MDDNKLLRMMHYYTETARQQEDYSGVNQIGVDETSKAKGHDYVSSFVDLAEKRTIFVAKGKGSETMTAFVKDLRGVMVIPSRSRMFLSTCPLPL